MPTIGRNLSRNPRAQKNLSTPIDNSSWPDWSEIIEDSGKARVNAYDLEGDFPRSVSDSPEKGLLQYYYFLDAEGTGRPVLKPGYRTPISTQGSVGGANYYNFRAIFNQSPNFDYVTNLYAPRNNSWFETYEIDKWHNEDRHSSERGKYKLTITPPGYGPATQNNSRFGTNFYTQSVHEYTGSFPITFALTTNSTWIDEVKRNNANYGDYSGNVNTDTWYYVPPGSTILVEVQMQDEWGPLFNWHPNEDTRYLDINALDVSWELNRPSTAQFLGVTEGYLIGEDTRDGVLNYTWKPTEGGNGDIYNEVGSLRVTHTNGHINEEPFFGAYGGGTFAADINTVPLAHSLVSAPNWIEGIGGDDRVFNNIRTYVDNSTLVEASTSSASTLFKAMQQISTGPNNYPNDFDDTVCTWADGGNDPKHFWNVQALSLILYISGARPLRTLSALDYALYGYEVDWRDWNNVQKYDIAVFKFKNASGGHVGFITDLNLADNKITIKGGNQANKFQETEYIIDNVDMHLLTVRRNWPLKGGNTYKLI